MEGGRGGEGEGREWKGGGEGRVEKEGNNCETVTSTFKHCTALGELFALH